MLSVWVQTPRSLCVAPQRAGAGLLRLWPDQVGPVTPLEQREQPGARSEYRRSAPKLRRPAAAAGL